MLITHRYLHLPVTTGAPSRRVALAVAGGPTREFDLELATDGPGDFRPFVDLGAWLGAQLTLTVDGQPAEITHLAFGDEIEGHQTLYREALRPQFHFTTRRGWINDPNGLCWLDGEWHLFFQHNPYGINWGNMHWGHAVSPDLLHWRELPIAVYPDAHGTCWSGSAVVDHDNTAGFGDGAMVLIYTAGGPAPCSQCLAVSPDGRQFTPYAANPVLPNIYDSNRDPKVYWHEGSGRWVMALYVDVPKPDLEGVTQTIQFFGSPNLKDWTHLSTLPGFYECPDWFELEVGASGERRWVVFAANGDYLVGDFDGAVFTPCQPLAKADWGKHRYAAQTFAEVPPADGRRIYIPWMNGGSYPGMPFNQQMGIPCELTLRRDGDRIALCKWPIRELAGLTAREQAWTDLELDAEGLALAEVGGELLDIELEFEPGTAAAVELTAAGQTIAWRAPGSLSCLGAEAPCPPEAGAVALRAVLDRASIEVFGQRGRWPLTSCFVPAGEAATPRLRAVGGPVRVTRLAARELRGVW